MTESRYSAHAALLHTNAIAARLSKHPSQVTPHALLAAERVLKRAENALARADTGTAKGLRLRRLKAAVFYALAHRNAIRSVLSFVDPAQVQEVDDQLHPLRRTPEQKRVITTSRFQLKTARTKLAPYSDAYEEARERRRACEHAYEEARAAYHLTADAYQTGQAERRAELGSQALAPHGSRKAMREAGKSVAAARRALAAARIAERRLGNQYHGLKWRIVELEQRIRTGEIS